MNAFLKLQQIRGILRGIERSRLKTPEKVTCVVYLHVILFRMHEKKYSNRKRIRYCIIHDIRVLNGQQK